MHITKIDLSKNGFKAQTYNELNPLYGTILDFDDFYIIRDHVSTLYLYKEKQQIGIIRTNVVDASFSLQGHTKLDFAGRFL